MRVVLIFCSLLFSGASAAQIDCSKLILDLNGYLGYQEAEVFPNPARKTVVRLNRQTKPYKINVCDVAVTADRGQYSFRAKDIKSLLNVTGIGYSWRYIIFGEQQTSSGPTYPEGATVTIALPDGFRTKVKITGYFSGQYLPTDALMAVRIDGGKLLPLLFNGQFRDVEVDPKMNTLELFIRSSKPLNWEKLVLDVRKSQMTFVKKSPFPASK